ncbi:MAG TPA: hypothetical protein VHE23_06920, partial [Candidatus Acidoferrales bacterium]|nr:hypothetical protein [Candidatus Acidoferrales bacterium]
MRKPFARSIFAAWLAGLLAAGTGTPTFAQEAGQTPAPAQKPAEGAGSPLSLGLSKHNFTRAPRPFPNLINPYRPVRVEEPNLTNSPRLDQMIQDGKIQLSLQGAI